MQYGAEDPMTGAVRRASLPGAACGVARLWGPVVVACSKMYSNMHLARAPVQLLLQLRMTNVLVHGCAKVHLFIECVRGLRGAPKIAVL